MNRQKQKWERITLRQVLSFRWLLLIGAIVVVGAVMSFGLVAVIGLGLNEHTALWMLAVIPPMAVVMILSAWITVHAVQKRMNGLLQGIRQVADGDMDVCLDTRNAAEYAELYQQFNNMVKELKSTKLEMQNFMNEFSHEFKTPITSIHGFAQYLISTGKGIETAEREEYLQIIADESLRLSELSQKTLLLSKVEACQILTEKTDFCLSEQIKRCAIMLLPQMEKKHIELEMDVGELSWRGNAELMEQVWLNLLNNAIKFTPECGEITIRAAKGADVISVSVADNGIGMNAETASRVFDKYYQHDMQNAARGNGVGLSIVKRIVELSGGGITVDSALGSGSTFTVVLPA